MYSVEVFQLLVCFQIDAVFRLEEFNLILFQVFVHLLKGLREGERENITYTLDCTEVKASHTRERERERSACTCTYHDLNRYICHMRGISKAHLKYPIFISYNNVSQTLCG